MLILPSVFHAACLMVTDKGGSIIAFFMASLDVVSGSPCTLFWKKYPSLSGPFWEVNVTYKLEAEFADCRQVFSDTKVKLYIFTYYNSYS